MAATYFRVPPNLNLLFHFWESEVGVYNCASGETHLLEKHAANLLRAFDGKDRSREFLNDYLLAALPSGSSGDIDEYLNDVLSQFRTMGLVEQCRGDFV